MINGLAVDCVKLIHGRWDLGIVAANTEDTRAMIEGSIEELAEELIEFGVADQSEKNLLKQDLSNSRLQIVLTFDGSDYPLRMKQEISLGGQPVVQFYGQLQFDLLEHKALYSLDELVVLGTKVDWDEVMQEAKEQQQEEEELSEAEQEELMTEIASTLDVEANPSSTTNSEQTELN